MVKQKNEPPSNLPYSLEQQQQIIDYLADNDVTPDLTFAILLCMFFGNRINEVLTLQKSNITDHNGMVGLSPFRHGHKRKNWFVGVTQVTLASYTTPDERDIRVETMKGSGPGGQHVNTTESAVRASRGDPVTESG